MTTRFTESKLPEFPAWSVAGGVDDAVRQALNALDLSNIENWWDPDEVPEEVVGFILEFFGVGTLDTPIFGLGFRRGIMRANAMLRRFRGTEFALQQFSEATGAIYSYQLTRNAYNRPTGITFTITPPGGFVAGAAWQSYMKRAFRWLLPPRLALDDFLITLMFEETIYHAGRLQFGYWVE